MAVTVQQAASNAFATWLATKLPGVQVLGRWPNPDAKLPAKAITVVTAGKRKDTPLDPQLLTHTNSGLLNTNATWLVAACSQPLQMDVWTRTHAERDDLLASLDVLLRAGASSLIGAYNPMPIGTDSGVLLALADGWTDTIADIYFEEPDLDESGDLYQASDFRATYRGNAHVMLSVATTTARQKINTFQLRLSEADTTYQDF